MNKKVGIGIAIVLALIIIGALMMQSGGQPVAAQNGTLTPEAPVATTPDSATTGTPATKPTTQTATKSAGSLRAEVIAAGNTECIYDSLSTVDNTVVIHSVINISGGKMYGEFHQRGTNTSNKILFYDGASAYTWTEGMATGQKRAVANVSDLKDLLPVDLSSATVFGNSKNNVSWDCHPWIPVKSKLVVPSYVSFK